VYLDWERRIKNEGLREARRVGRSEKREDHGGTRLVVFNQSALAATGAASWSGLGAKGHGRTRECGVVEAAVDDGGAVPPGYPLVDLHECGQVAGG
jgi:hypothetical protein